MVNNENAQAGNKNPGMMKNALITIAALGTLALLTYVGPNFGVPHVLPFLLSLIAIALSLWAIGRAKKSQAMSDMRGSLNFIFIGSAWVAFVNALYLIAGPPRQEALEIDVLAPQTSIMGFGVSTAVVWTWVVMAILFVACLAFRFLIFPRFSEIPTKIQNAFEAMVEWIENYAEEKTDHDYGLNLGAYTFSVAVMLISLAMLELFKIRAPTADVTVTGAFAVCSFVLFNYYSFKRLGFLGKLKWYFEPTPILAPVKIIIDLAKPVSLACRLYGNMLGGFIIMDLFYMTFNYSSAGFQGLLGLFFNIFHPLVQVLIFVTLSLTYIAEATE